MFIPQENSSLLYVASEGNGPMQTALDAGVYATHFDNQGQLFFRPATVSSETLVDLTTPTSVRVHRELTSFFNPDITTRLLSAGLKHRRAILLYGPAGTGKTSLMRSTFPTLIKHNAIVLLEPDISALEGRIIPAVRFTDPHRPIAIIFDEFHSVVSSSGSIRILQLLDGLRSPQHILLMGTTNFINRIPKTLCQRPSRFSLVLEVDELPRSARVAYIRGKYPMLDNAEELVDITLKFALDYLEEAGKLTLMGESVRDIADRFAAIDVTDARRRANEDDDEDFD